MSEENTAAADSAAPEENHELAGQLIRCEDTAECCNAAAQAADERSEDAIDWSELIETPASAMTHETFKDRVGEKFSLQIASKILELQLVTTHVLAAPGHLVEGDAPAAREQFAVTFEENDPTISLSDGIYRLEHDDLGEFEVYLEEVKAPNEDGSEAKDQRYEAVFC